MKPAFSVSYHEDVIKYDIPRLSHPVKERIKNTIEAKLSHAPLEFGEPLRGTYKGYWKLRVGDYRVIYSIEGAMVAVLRIGHRSEVYYQS